MQKLKGEFKFENEEEFILQMIKAYEACPSAVKYIASLGLSEEKIKDNITKIYNLVCDINYCKKCPGFSKCAKENPHLVTKIIYEYGQVERQLTPCKALLRQIDLEKQFVCKDFDKEFLNKDLKDIDAKDIAGRKNLLNKYRNYLKDNDTTWLYVTGAEGTGRSFLASILAVDIAKREKGPIAFLNTPARFKELANLSLKDEVSFQKKINMLCSVPVLVLDDFGNEFKTEFVRDAILLTIISKRSARKLFTILTSDFSLDDIVTMYDTSKAAGVRARQIGRILSTSCAKEINLGEIPVFQESF